MNKEKQMDEMVEAEKYGDGIVKDTNIQMADGKGKTAKELQIGDVVCCYGERAMRVLDIIQGTESTAFQITTENGSSIIVAREHLIMCEGESNCISKLKVGDSLNLVSGGRSKITEIKPIPYNDRVYHFVFEGAEKGTYIAANGFWVGDWPMHKVRVKQEKLTLSESEMAFINEMEKFSTKR